MGDVLVIGSANLDTVVRVRTHPLPGQTVIGHSSSLGTGGKGANQAVAAARAEIKTTFVVSLGDDQAGKTIQTDLTSAGVILQSIASDSPTGSAIVIVSDSGENAIVVVSGANSDEKALSEALAAASTSIDSATVMLTQLEIPIPTVRKAMQLANKHGVRTILNAAPITPTAVSLLDLVDFLIVNEHECVELAELAANNDSDGASHAVDNEVPATSDTATAVTTAARVLAKLVPTVVVTLGGDGVLLIEQRKETSFSAYSVDTVDTTGAGDTFCGALAAELAAGSTTQDAIGYATAAAALSVQRPGATAAIPTRDEVAGFLARNQPIGFPEPP